MDLSNVCVSQIERGLQKLDLHRLYKNGHIERDYRGYFTFEIPLDFFQSNRLEKFYIEEEYVKLENTLERLNSEGKTLKSRISKELQHNFSLVERLIQLDFQILQLIIYYTGKSHLPILSYRQIMAWVNQQKHFFHLFNLDSTENPTPLSSITFLEKNLGKRKMKDWIKDLNKENHKSKDSNLLLTTPYRFTKKHER